MAVRYLRFAVWVAIAAAIVAGLYARITGVFGDRPVAIDEYYFLTSVRNIMAEGIPAFPSGGYYFRGLLVQYATAASLLLFGEQPFAMRLVPAASGLGCAVALYFYARGQLCPMLAASVSALYMVSSWAIEFSLFIRMYTAFQLATLLFLLAADRAWFGKWWHLRYLPHVLVVIAALTHEAAVLLAPLLMTPLLVLRDAQHFPSRSHAVHYGLVSLAVLALCVALFVFDFRDFGVADAVPRGLEWTSAAMFRFPEFPFLSFGSDPFLNTAVMAAVLALVAASLSLVCLKNRWFPVSFVYAGVLVAAAVLHQFIIAGACAAILLLRYRILRLPLRDGPPLRALMLAMLIVGLWITYAVTTREWIGAVADGDNSLAEALIRTFAGWPDFYSELVNPWRRDAPVLGLIIAIACVIQLVGKLHQPLPALARNPVCVIAYTALVYGVLNAPYSSTRYSFFVYPLALFVIVLSVVDITRWVTKRGAGAAIGAEGSRDPDDAVQVRTPHRLPPAPEEPRTSSVDSGHGASAAKAPAVAAAVSLVVMAFSSDLSVRHLASVTAPDAVFRTGAFAHQQYHWYAREDIATPAEFLNAEAANGSDTPIVVVGLPHAAAYLEAEHALYLDRKDPRYRQQARESGRRHLWSNRPLLGTFAELRKHVGDADRVWIMRAAAGEKWPINRTGFALEDVWPSRIAGMHRAFLSRDSRIEVVAVELTPER
ncbi:MAG: glycosyltransferase family 39 protein [Rhodospirillales bacterium]|nr:glycosyltransferase family 39 protein [Rhodospirillales bacterium]